MASEERFGYEWRKYATMDLRYEEQFQNWTGLPVQAWKGNEWIVWFINPIRKYITSRLPLPLVHLLSYGASIPLYFFVKILRGPTPYLAQLATFKFKHIHSIVFDQLIPEVANYWRLSEVQKLIETLPLTQVSVKCPRNGMGWILTATKQ